MNTITRRLGFVSLLAAFAGGAHAGLVFSGIDANPLDRKQVDNVNSGAAETQFKSHLVGVGTENFESKVAGSTSPLTTNFGAAGSATLNGGGSVQQNNPNNNNGGRYSVPGGRRYWETNANAGGSFNVTFSNSIAAFGFYGTDLGDFGGTLQLQFRNSLNQLVDTQTVSEAAANQANASLVYFGYIADIGKEFSSINFILRDTVSGTQDVFGFDSFTIGTREQVTAQVPEPNAAALVGAALVSLAVVRRRNKRS